VGIGAMERDELVELDPASRGHLPDAVKNSR
jgi:hypothetical protein